MSNYEELQLDKQRNREQVLDSLLQVTRSGEEQLSALDFFEQFCEELGLSQGAVLSIIQELATNKLNKALTLSTSDEIEYQHRMSLLRQDRNELSVEEDEYVLWLQKLFATYKVISNIDSSVVTELLRQTRRRINQIEHEIMKLQAHGRQPSTGNSFHEMRSRGTITGRKLG
jgi:hypothetical protein